MKNRNIISLHGFSFTIWNELVNEPVNGLIEFSLDYVVDTSGENMTYVVEQGDIVKMRNGDECIFMEFVGRLREDSCDEGCVFRILDETDELWEAKNTLSVFELGGEIISKKGDE